MRRGGRPLRRSYGQREERQRILIYCEGERTEVDYFKGVRRDLRASNVDLEIVSGRGEPAGMVRMAIDRRARETSTARPDQIWCVFDVEAPLPHAKLDLALALARQHGIQCAISSPCFELFLLLHFQDQTAYLDTEQAGRLLEECSCGYRRRSKGVDYDAVRPGQHDARRRAGQLDRRFSGTALSDRNPWTNAHLLLETLSQEAGPISGTQNS